MGENIFTRFDQVAAGESGQALWAARAPYRPEAGFDLMLSGHTHGGQICLPGGIPILLEADVPRALGAGPSAGPQAGGRLRSLPASA